MKSLPFTIRYLTPTSLSCSQLHPSLSSAHSSKSTPLCTACHVQRLGRTRCPRVLHTPNVAFAPTEQTQQSAGPTSWEMGVRGGGREGPTEIYNKHEEQMKMSCSQLATPLTPVQALSRTNGNARVCHALVVAFGRGTRERGRDCGRGRETGWNAGSLLLALSSTGHARSLDRAQNDLRSVLMLRKIAEQGAFTN